MTPSDVREWTLAWDGNAPVFDETALLIQYHDSIASAWSAMEQMFTRQREIAPDDPLSFALLGDGGHSGFALVDCIAPVMFDALFESPEKLRLYLDAFGGS